MFNSVKVENELLLSSTVLCSRQLVVSLPWLSLLTVLLKPLNTSALPHSGPVVIVCCACQSAGPCIFCDGVWQGLQTHSGVCPSLHVLAWEPILSIDLKQPCGGWFGVNCQVVGGWGKRVGGGGEGVEGAGFFVWVFSFLFFSLSYDLLYLPHTLQLSIVWNIREMETEHCVWWSKGFFISTAIFMSYLSLMLRQYFWHSQLHVTYHGFSFELHTHSKKKETWMRVSCRSFFLHWI